MPMFSAVKGYLKPASKAGQAGQAAASQDEKTSVHSNPYDGTNTPISMPSRMSSRPSSLYPHGDFRNLDNENINDIKCDVMVNWLHQQQLESMWSSGAPGEGIVLKRRKDQFVSCPSDLAQETDGLYDAVKALNVKVAMTVNTRVIKLFLQRTDMPYVPLANNLRLQILPDIQSLPFCQKHHFAAFIHDSSLLVVWDDEPRDLLRRAKSIENQLMEMIWSADEEVIYEEKPRPSNYVMSDVSGDEASSNDNVESLIEPPRQIKLNGAVMVGLTLILLIAALGAGWRQVAQEITVDKKMIRLAFLAVVPLQAWLALFFMQSLVGSLCQMLGPVSHVTKGNTKFYSATRPTRIRTPQLPHVTIQCPVYKEGLAAVIEPTVKSVKAAISTYEMQGGTASIFVNDDGMQLLAEDEAQERREFYEEHNIGWVARPKHNAEHEDGTKFLRAGKFKKASNMNYALTISGRVEEKLARIFRPATWTQDDEISSYKHQLKQVIDEDAGKTWADGNIRIGDYILIIDSDTRVPSDCFLDAVSEMEQCPQVAIIQFSSGVMNVTTSFFERGITFFTHLIYTAIAFAVASGDVAPFVGHNAILRWSAIQDVAYVDKTGEKADMYWSETTVSEDFDMALRLQSAGYLVRYASYMGDGFKEGVSLTVYDELARWEKYAYGCSELIFHPLRYWFTRGPFTKLFRTFIGSRMPFPSKLTILAYIGTYYAIGSAWLLTLMNYFIIGWFNGYLDHYYIDSFRIFFSIIIVFTTLGNVALAIFRYRIGAKSLVGAFVENISWILVLAVFLGGISMHVSFALVAHLVGYDVQWGATSKEAENTNFFQEVPKVLKKFNFVLPFCFAMLVGIVCLVHVVPPLWRIDSFIAIFPLCNVLASHILLPIVLNPGLMMFTW